MVDQDHIKKERMNILLVEDSPAQARLIKEMLSESPDIIFKLVWVEEINECKKQLSEMAFDAILLDLGVALLEYLKN